MRVLKMVPLLRPSRTWHSVAPARTNSEMTAVGRRAWTPGHRLGFQWVVVVTPGTAKVYPWSAADMLQSWKRWRQRLGVIGDAVQRRNIAMQQNNQPASSEAQDASLESGEQLTDISGQLGSAVSEGAPRTPAGEVGRNGGQARVLGAPCPNDLRFDGEVPRRAGRYWRRRAHGPSWSRGPDLPQCNPAIRGRRRPVRGWTRRQSLRAALDGHAGLASAHGGLRQESWLQRVEGDDSACAFVGRPLSEIRCRSPR
jgi:hypothetical protein